jgi:hypothetical protein
MNPSQEQPSPTRVRIPKNTFVGGEVVSPTVVRKGEDSQEAYKRGWLAALTRAYGKRSTESDETVKLNLAEIAKAAMQNGMTRQEIADHLVSLGISVETKTDIKSEKPIEPVEEPAKPVDEEPEEVPLDEKIFNLAVELKKLVDSSTTGENSLQKAELHKKLQEAITAYKTLRLKEGYNESIIAIKITHILKDSGLVFQREEKEPEYPDWINEVIDSQESKVFLHRTSEENASNILNEGLWVGADFLGTASGSGVDEESAFKKLLEIHQRVNWVVIIKIPQKIFEILKENKKYNQEQDHMANIGIFDLKPENINAFLFDHFFDAEKGSVIIPPEWVYGMADQKTLEMVRNNKFNLNQHQDFN